MDLQSMAIHGIEWDNGIENNPDVERNRKPSIKNLEMEEEQNGNDKGLQNLIEMEQKATIEHMQNLSTFACLILEFVLLQFLCALFFFSFQISSMSNDTLNSFKNWQNWPMN